MNSRMAAHMIPMAMGAAQEIDLLQGHPQLFQRGKNMFVHILRPGSAIDQHVFFAAHQRNPRPGSAEGHGQAINVRPKLNKFRHSPAPFQI